MNMRTCISPLEVNPIQNNDDQKMNIFSRMIVRLGIKTITNNKEELIFFTSNYNIFIGERDSRSAL